jgi:two-component SAPR family response regulator
MTDLSTSNRESFKGLRVLIVEDMFLVAEELSYTLQDWGCEVVGPAAGVNEALKLVENESVDGALLDVNLGDDRCFPIAVALQKQGVPFVFLTGYDMSSAFPAEFESVLRLPKPVDLQRLANAMDDSFAREAP